jgi:hypothetical protein
MWLPQVHDGTNTPLGQFLKDPDSLLTRVTWKDEQDKVWARPCAQLRAVACGRARGCCRTLAEPVRQRASVPRAAVLLADWGGALAALAAAPAAPRAAGGVGVPRAGHARLWRRRGHRAPHLTHP